MVSVHCGFKVKWKLIVYFYYIPEMFTERFEYKLGTHQFLTLQISSLTMLQY